MQTLRRLAQAIIPFGVLTYGVIYNAVWAQNLFVGWAVFLVVVGAVLCVGVPVMAAEDPKKLRERGHLVETDWIRIVAKGTAVAELIIVVASGWWWTAIFYSVGWGLNWLGRETYSEALDRIGEEEEDETPLWTEQSPTLN